MLRVSGSAATRVIWQPLLKGKFDGYYNQVSMAWLWARLHIRANSRDKKGDGEQLGYYRGGFARVTRALEREIRSRGAQIELDTTIESIDRNADGRPCFMVAGQSRAFDSVIFTGSTHAFARLLRPTGPALEAYANQLRSIQYLGAICLVFASTQDLGDFYWLNINSPDAPFLVFINHTKLIPPDHYNGRHVYYIGSYQSHDSAPFQSPPEAIKDRWYAYLKKMHPGFERTAVVEEHVFKLRDAQHIVDTEYEAKVPPYKTPLPGIYLSNFAQIFPEDRGTNFAVLEGN
jgi:protoporphyrinogen oxidase